ncbi:hypothetical protein QUH73_13715 [Labilibaculum sp. K2S]|uniref:hypothetical protein n=1 Tax=Labilibaculum sp. K2S TaxID=3056386 RepID=UPI0025A42667|nr:hypothetical protein [Labilibaculum sp. K2S]MDM8160876.1 hypothetical protein [Labilibaculum sp. K2S]
MKKIFNKAVDAKLKVKIVFEGLVGVKSKDNCLFHASVIKISGVEFVKNASAKAK